jgi:hypothetical protein
MARRAQDTLSGAQLGTTMESILWDAARLFLWSDPNPANAGLARRKAEEVRRMQVEERVLVERLARTKEYLNLLEQGGTLIPGCC